MDGLPDSCFAMLAIDPCAVRVWGTWAVDRVSDLLKRLREATLHCILDRYEGGFEHCSSAYGRPERSLGEGIGQNLV
jgi:hypothetical protein